MEGMWISASSSMAKSVIRDQKANGRSTNPSKNTLLQRVCESAIVGKEFGAIGKAELPPHPKWSLLEA